MFNTGARLLVDLGVGLKMERLLDLNLGAVKALVLDAPQVTSHFFPSFFLFHRVASPGYICDLPILSSLDGVDLVIVYFSAAAVFYVDFRAKFSGKKIEGRELLRLLVFIIIYG